MRFVVEGRSKQVISEVVVIFTQRKSGHMFACCKIIINASPVFMGILLAMSSISNIIEHIARSYLAGFWQAVGTKCGVDAW